MDHDLVYIANHQLGSCSPAGRPLTHRADVIEQPRCVIERDRLYSQFQLLQALAAVQLAPDILLDLYFSLDALHAVTLLLCRRARRHPCGHAPLVIETIFLN